MHTIPSARLVVPALAALALTCDAQQSTTSLAASAVSVRASSDRRMNAHTTEIKASHVVFISRPNQVAKIILEAAATVGTVGATAQ